MLVLGVQPDKHT